MVSGVKDMGIRCPGFRGGPGIKPKIKDTVVRCQEWRETPENGSKRERHEYLVPVFSRRTGNSAKSERHRL